MNDEVEAEVETNDESPPPRSAETDGDVSGLNNDAAAGAGARATRPVREPVPEVRREAPVELIRVLITRAVEATEAGRPVPPWIWNLIDRVLNPEP